MASWEKKWIYAWNKLVELFPDQFSKQMSVNEYNLQCQKLGIRINSHMPIDVCVKHINRRFPETIYKKISKQDSANFWQHFFSNWKKVVSR